MKKIAFTLCSNNYIAQASLLVQSFIEANPDFIMYIGLVDKIEPSLQYPVSENIFILPCENVIDADELKRMSSIYKIVELNTSLKPYYFNFFFKKYPESKVIYLDPDIYVYNTFDEIVNLLDEYDFLITPHCLTSIPLDGKFPSERSFMKYGIYNLGFIALKKSDASISFVKWWQERLSVLCYSETEIGVYVDQSWVEFLPSFYDKVYISKSFGWNCAFWNLHERFFDKERGKILVNKKDALLFFHFSSLNLNDINSLAKGQTRYTIESRPDIKLIFETYATAFGKAKEIYKSDFPCFYTKRTILELLNYYINRFNIRKEMFL